MRSLFIYWKLPAAAAEAALQAARLWQAELRAAHPHLVTHLYRRTDARAVAEGLTTVMESYAAPGGVNAMLQAAIDSAGQTGLRPFGAPQRHAELFDAADG